MTAAVLRKSFQLLKDPVLRRWLIGRLSGRCPKAPPFAAFRPPYLQGLLPLVEEAPAGPSSPLSHKHPETPIRLPLPGETITLSSGEEGAVFERSFADIETLLGLHRFAWLPLMGVSADPAWVNVLWRAWAKRFAKPNSDWPWHPYTAAERAINILRFGRRHGLPGPAEETLSLLAAHGPAIAEQLEYFGEHHTSNHLANNGRGLFILGLELGLPVCADLGGQILIDEAKRIFLPSGMLREGSSHYHLLLTRGYASAWLAARAHDRPETGDLESIARRAVAVLPRLALPGGFPLVGDVSPDCPPDHLCGLMRDGDPASGWSGLLDEKERKALRSLCKTVAPVSLDLLAGDGWIRSGLGPWQGLWHAAPGGWSHMPGHGHQDCGGFELHYGDEPVFRDPGRGAYGEDGGAALYRSAPMHNTLIVDGKDPYPPNKPYYDEAFRCRVCGPPPAFETGDGRVALRHSGFSRFKDVGEVVRRWRFTERSFTLTDRVEGRGRHVVSRFLHSPLAMEKTPEGMVVKGSKGTYRISAEGSLVLSEVTHWHSYGSGHTASTLRIDNTVNLPWESAIAVEAC